MGGRSPGRRDPVTAQLMYLCDVSGRTTMSIATGAGVPRSTLAMARTRPGFSVGMWTALKLARYFGYDIVLRRRRDDG